MTDTARFRPAPEYNGRNPLATPDEFRCAQVKHYLAVTRYTLFKDDAAGRKSSSFSLSLGCMTVTARMGPPAGYFSSGRRRT